VTLGAGAALVIRAQPAPRQRAAPPVALAESPRRARPPAWSVDVLDAFFDDARTMLVGERPDYAGANLLASGGGDRSTPAASPAAPPGALWSKIIDATTVETEIKRLAQAVAPELTSPSQFKGGGYRACRQHFSLLAVLFAVTGEYDGPIRWQDAAPGLREAFARAGRNAKVGTDATYNEAAARKQDLDELVRGSRPQNRPAERAATWGEVAERPPLMQRLNVAHEARLTKWLASEREFAVHRDDVRHEAQIVAMLADVLGREGFDYWDENDYSSAARELRAAAGDAAAAVKLENYEQVRRAVDRAGKACASCHEVYRG
jgi:hypothetical protein